MTDQPRLSYAALLRNTEGLVDDLTGGRSPLELDPETRAMARGVIALFEAMSEEVSKAFDPEASATFHENLARLRELVREPDAPAADDGRSHRAPSRDA
ncbi:integrase [Burkholderia gladioli]|uniref:integrase n=1 Tax=Burkholderia gladioli TaxID=28095 RepID=UPI00163EAE0C|nr:integrase [Burkholderia gladioli]MBU9170865.1 integrase [Burkholderia gladioli]MBU9218890.1 integrase [Burkholderia gladioli]MBU9385438.1 integrase [Burkholderia gladioli]MDN7728267.1 integrase [Burkholderia gladioli]MDN7755036.1 integrase [Burkholderia gladioli]